MKLNENIFKMLIVNQYTYEEEGDDNSAWFGVAYL